MRQTAICHIENIDMQTSKTMIIQSNINTRLLRVVWCCSITEGTDTYQGTEQVFRIMLHDCQSL